jgi:hypothetical protein
VILIWASLMGVSTQKDDSEGLRKCHARLNANNAKENTKREGKQTLTTTCSEINHRTGCCQTHLSRHHQTMQTPNRPCYLPSPTSVA